MTIKQTLSSIMPANRKAPEQFSLWRGSMLGRCYREQTLNAFGIRFPIDENLHKKFALHSVMHEAVQKWIEAKFTATARPEWEFVLDNLRVSGHIDELILGDDGCATVVEVKTLNEHFARKIAKGEIEPYWKHQIELYRHAVAQKIDEVDNVDAYSVIVTLMGDVNVVQVPESTEFLDILSVLNAFWDMGIVPPAGWDTGHDKQCDKCPIRHVCTEPVDDVNEFKDMARKALYT